MINGPKMSTSFEYDGNTNAMLQVRNGVHDATLLDLPMAIFYRDKPQGKGPEICR